jgi:hypothetical protein
MATTLKSNELNRQKFMTRKLKYQQLTHIVEISKNIGAAIIRTKKKIFPQQLIQVIDRLAEANQN